MNERQYRRRRSRQMATARRMSEDAARCTIPLQLEWWASCVLGQWWELRHLVDYDDGWPVLLGAPIAQDIASIGGTGAKRALLALARVDPTMLGVICADLASELRAPVPEWLDQVGEAKVTKAAWHRRPSEGEVILIGLDRLGEPSHSIVAFVDEWQDGLAKHLRISTPFEEARQAFDPPEPRSGSPIILKPTEPAFVCKRIETAMRLTDAAPLPRLGDQYPGVRALALNAVRQVIQPRVIRNGFSVDGSQTA
jgi:hypothetical protein